MALPTMILSLFLSEQGRPLRSHTALLKVTSASRKHAKPREVRVKMPSVRDRIRAGAKKNDSTKIEIRGLYRLAGAKFSSSSPTLRIRQSTWNQHVADILCGPVIINYFLS